MTGDDPDGVYECDCKPDGNHVSRFLAEGGDTFKACSPGVYHPGDVLQRPLAGQQMLKNVHRASQHPLRGKMSWMSYGINCVNVI